MAAALKTWWSASDIAASACAALPGNLAGASALIAQLRETSPDLVIPRVGKGGGHLVAYAALPAAARAELERQAQASTMIVQQSQELADVAEIRTRQLGAAVQRDLGGRQRAVMEARAALLMEIERRALLAGRGKKAVAAAAIAGLRAGLDPEFAELAKRASDRPRASGLSVRTVMAWFGARERGGTAALAPVPTREKQALPAWFEAFIPFYAKPSKPEMSEALREFCRSLPPGAPRPSIDQVRRCIAKLSAIEKAQGREGKVAIRRLQAYVSRDASVLLPTHVYVADGTTWDAEVAHPIHGRPFKPEITSIIDAATRLCVGWSAGLAESTWVVADALRRAVGRYGVPAIFYSDRGPGYRNAAMDAPLTGIVSRLGCTHDLTRPRNAQAKGNIERFQKLWIKVAKRQQTFTGREMDREARLAAFKTTRREIALFGASRMLPAWADFVWAVEDEIADYNDRPHRGLPQLRDPVTGRRRHASPNEAWAAHVAQGFQAMVPEASELEDLFRPYEVRRVARCLVSVNTNSYFSNALEHWHGRDVIVGYDIADGSRVWVRQIDEVDGEQVPGKLICVAAFEGNRVDYVPATKLQRAEELRFKGRMRRVQDKIDEIEAEHRPSLLIDAQAPRPLQLSGVARKIAAPEFSAPPAMPVLSSVPEAPVAAEPASPTGRPRFPDEAAFAAWLVANPDQMTATDQEYIQTDLLDETSQSWLRQCGVDVGMLRELARRPVGERAA